MIYAAIVFPKSASPTRPRSTLTDRAVGSLTMVVLIATAALSIWLIVMGGSAAN
jgi:hypothetical protein